MGGFFLMVDALNKMRVTIIHWVCIMPIMLEVYWQLHIMSLVMMRYSIILNDFYLSLRYIDDV